MTDEGFQVGQYVIDIKQLRFNYTSFDIDGSAATPEKKQLMWDAIKNLNKNERSYELVQAYEWAAEECKERKDPENDK